MLRDCKFKNKGGGTVDNMGKIFVSYSHKDVQKVKQFVSQLSLQGFNLWMDEKDIPYGKNYTSEILRGIHDSDIYLVFISESSVSSPWVMAEIDFALREKIENRLQIIPVKLDDVDIPLELSGINHIDARFSLIEAAKEVAEELCTGEMEDSANELRMVSTSFVISKKTAVEIGPFNADLTKNDLDADRDRLLSELRKKAYGILLNFVLVEGFDLQSETPRFENGLYEEDSWKIAGSTSGSICEKVMVQAIVFNPDEKKVMRLLRDRLGILSINALSFGYVLPTKDGETILSVGKRCLQRIQDRYTILSYDAEEGARIEISKDFFLAFMVSEEVVKIQLMTTYDWQFEKAMEGFSPVDFLKELLYLSAQDCPEEQL